MSLNFSLSFCKITLAAKLFVKCNYFPILKPLSPADARNQSWAVSGQAVPLLSHYMPVLFSSSSTAIQQRLQEPPDLYGKRSHGVISDFRYLEPEWDPEAPSHKQLLDIVKHQQHGDGFFVYLVDEKEDVLVVTGKFEEAIRNGDIADVVISDCKDKIIVKLRGLQKVRMDLREIEAESLPLAEGEGVTSKEAEKDRHYGKDTMMLVRIFEAKEASAAEVELEMMRQKAERKRRIEEEEIKRQMQTIIEKLDIESDSVAQEEEIEEVRMKVRDLRRTSCICDKLVDKEVLKQLPSPREIPKLVKNIANGVPDELEEVSGIRFKLGQKDRFLPGQMVETAYGEVFIPGQTVVTEHGPEYMPGFTVNIGDTPTLIPGVIMTNEFQEPVFLPGQTTISESGDFKLPKEQNIKVTDMSEIQFTRKEKEEREVKRKKALEANRVERKKKETARLEHAVVQEVQQLQQPQKAEKEWQMKIEEEITTEEVEEEIKREEEELMAEEAPEAEEAAVRVEITPPKEQTPPREPTPPPEQQTANGLEEFRKLIEDGKIFDDLSEEDLAKFDIEDLLLKQFLEQLDEERRRNAEIGEKMKEVLQTLELKKAQIIERLDEVKFDHYDHEDRIKIEKTNVTYVDMEKASKLAKTFSLSMRNQETMANVLLTITRRAVAFPEKSKINAKNINSLKQTIYTVELNEQFGKCCEDTKTALMYAVFEAVQSFKEKPKDQESAMAAAFKTLSDKCMENPLVTMEICRLLSTSMERNNLFTKVLKQLSQETSISKIESLRSIINHEADDHPRVVESISKVLEDDGDILGAAFKDISSDQPDLVNRVLKNISLNETDIVSEKKATQVLTRGIVRAVNDKYKHDLNSFLASGSTEEVKQLLHEAMGLAKALGLSFVESNLAMLCSDHQSLELLSGDQITLDILRRICVMRRICSATDRLGDVMRYLHQDPEAAKYDSRVREVVRKSGALVANPATIESSAKIPRALFEPDNALAMEDFVAQRLKSQRPVLVVRRDLQAVIPKEASRSVLAGKQAYTLIDEGGVSHFRPLNNVSAVGLARKHVSDKILDYPCLGGREPFADRIQNGSSDKLSLLSKCGNSGFNVRPGQQSLLVA